MMWTKFERALFEGKVSPTLLKLWEEKNNPKAEMTCGDIVFEKRTSVMLISLFAGLAALLFFLLTRKDIVWIAVAPIALMTLVAGTQGFGRINEFTKARQHLAKHIFKRTSSRERGSSQLLPNEQFLHDIEELATMLSVKTPGFLSKDELVSRANNQMITFAGMVLACQETEDGSSDTVEMMMGGAVKDGFGIFSRFGLLSKSLGQYYKEAAAILPEAAGRDTPIATSFANNIAATEASAVSETVPTA